MIIFAFGDPLVCLVTLWFDVAFLRQVPAGNMTVEQFMEHITKSANDLVLAKLSQFKTTVRVLASVRMSHARMSQQLAPAALPTRLEAIGPA